MLEGFFSPRAVAVVGASREEGKVGHEILDNLISAGFSGPVYPVNPAAFEIDGLRCYASVAELPPPVDLAVIVVPAPLCSGVVAECGRAGIGSVIVVSAGFRESGREGGVLERELAETAARSGVRLLGPNCLGLVSTGSHLNASFSGSWPTPGRTAFLSQSGALGTAVLDASADGRLGISHFVSLGNRADVSEADLMDEWAADEGSRCVAAYLEGVADGAAFVASAGRLTRVKPLVVLKSGTSDAGARAASSHTGSLAGSDRAFAAALARCGAVRADTAEELFDLMAAFGTQPLPSAGGLAILTNAGGPGVLATDAADRTGLPLASLAPDTLSALRACLPGAAAVYNPVDVLGDAGPDRISDACTALVADSGVSSVMLVLTPQAMTDVEGACRAFADAVSGRATAVACLMGGARMEAGASVLRHAGIPDFSEPSRAVTVLAAMRAYSASLAEPPDSADMPSGDRGRAVATLASAGTAHHFLAPDAVTDVLRAYGIPVAEGRVVGDLQSALAVAQGTGYPVALKVVSAELTHKTDLGGVVLDIGGPEQLHRDYDQLLARVRQLAPDARVQGVQVQRMVPAGREVVVGVTRDPQFGPLVMAGLGGIYVEVLKDVSFRLCPVTPREVRRMLAELRGFPLLRGVRGQPPADIDAVVDCVVRASVLAADLPEVVEMDLNPLIVADKGGGAIVADARIGIGGAP